MIPELAAQMVCGICGVPLDHRQEWEMGSPDPVLDRYEHPAAFKAASAGHEPVPVVACDGSPGTSRVCDVCSEPDPVWKYPAADFVAGAFVDFSGNSAADGSVGAWALCDGCADATTAGEPAALTARAVVAAKRQGRPTPPFLVQALRELHRGFFAHRNGPRHRIR